MSMVLPSVRNCTELEDQNFLHTQAYTECQSTLKERSFSARQLCPYSTEQENQFITSKVNHDSHLQNYRTENKCDSTLHPYYPPSTALYSDKGLAPVVSRSQSVRSLSTATASSKSQNQSQKKAKSGQKQIKETFFGSRLASQTAIQRNKRDRTEGGKQKKSLLGLKMTSNLEMKRQTIQPERSKADGLNFTVYQSS